MNPHVKRCPECGVLLKIGDHPDRCRTGRLQPKPQRQENLLQLPLGFSGPLVRRDDPDTSQEAADAITPKRLTEIQQDVLAWFHSHRHGTDEDIERALHEKHPAFSTVRNRRCDLVTLGYLRDSGERRINSNKRNMIVWEVVTDAPNNAARELEQQFRAAKVPVIQKFNRQIAPLLHKLHKLRRLRNVELQILRIEIENKLTKA
jgi:hypothetical protein